MQRNKKRLKTQLEHKQRWKKLLSMAYISEKERFQKEINKADMIIESLRKEFILAVERWSTAISDDSIKAQWDMTVKEVERGL